MKKIGQVSKETDINIDTLRYYERIGLVAPSLRSEAGYRLYSALDINELNFIKRCKSLGFSLAEVSELLSLKLEKSKHSCAEVKQVAAAHLQQVTERIEELEKVRAALHTLYDKCCGGDVSAEHCSILSELEK